MIEKTSFHLSAVVRAVEGGSTATKLLAWESRPLPAIRNYSHDEWLCTFSHLLYINSWKCHQLAAGQLLPGRMVLQAAWTVHHVQNYIPAGSLSFIQLGGPPRRVSSLAFGLNIIILTPGGGVGARGVGHCFLSVDVHKNLAKYL